MREGIIFLFFFPHSFSHSFSLSHGENCLENRLHNVACFVCQKVDKFLNDNRCIFCSFTYEELNEFTYLFDEISDERKDVKKTLLKHCDSIQENDTKEYIDQHTTNHCNRFQICCSLFDIIQCVILFFCKILIELKFHLLNELVFHCIEFYFVFYCF